MMEDDRAEDIEEEYGMPPGRLMYCFYQERDMSQHEISEKLTEDLGEKVPRETVRYWLQRAGIKMRSRTLTDIQRVLIMAYLSSGMGLDSTATKAQCGRATVQRYRKEIKGSGKPVDLEQDLSTKDWEILCDIIEADLGGCVNTPSESTSNCAADST